MRGEGIRVKWTDKLLTRNSRTRDDIKQIGVSRNRIRLSVCMAQPQIKEELGRITDSETLFLECNLKPAILDFVFHNVVQKIEMMPMLGEQSQ